jgi:hypothetical protein
MCSVDDVNGAAGWGRIDPTQSLHAGVLLGYKMPHPVPVTVLGATV